METPPKCRTKLISDISSTNDSFGPHERIAQAIAELISNEEGGKSIGLEGGWGSGKSTVINLVAQKVSDQKDSSILLFDAWAHQNDPLRRTFLEQIIETLKKDKWIEPKHWDEKREELAKRRRITETRTYPKLTKLGKLLLVSAFAVPIGIAFISAGLRDNVSLNLTSGLPFAWNFIIGLCLTLLPLIVLLLRIGWAQWSLRSRGSSAASSEENHDIWAILAQKFVANTQTETIETPDPTSVEFENLFTGLMQEALAPPGRKLVIVLDNIDRVNHDDALAILSTLQTFLQYNERQNSDWLKKLWVIIPYDPSGLKHLWESRTAGGADTVALSFVDKRFQIRFEVPPLALSDWRSYLMELLRTAFPDHDPQSEDFHDVYRVLLTEKTGKNIYSPTPRDLKIFVNQIGAIHRQWQDQFPLAHVAYYVLLHRNETNVTEALLNGRIPELKFGGILGTGIHDNLAALAFNTDVPSARQLLLRGPLENALSAGDAERIKELASYPKGFWEVLEQIDFNIWTKTEGHKIANSAWALVESRAFESAQPAVKSSVIKAIGKASLTVNSWLPLNSNTAPRIASLVRLTQDHSVEQRILAVLSGDSGTEEKTQIDLSSIADWSDGIIVLLREIKQLGLREFSSQGIKAPTDARGFVELCSRIYLSDPGAEFWASVKPAVSSEEIANAIQAMIEAGELSMKYASAIQVFKSTLADFPWRKITQPIYGSRLGNSGGLALPGPEICASLQTLWILKDVDPKVDNMLDQSCQQGHILHHLHQANAIKDKDATAWCIFTYLTKVPAASTSPAFGNSEGGFNYLTQFLNDPDTNKELNLLVINLIEKYSDLQFFFGVIDAAPSAKRWVIECLKETARRKTAPALYKPEIVIGRWPLLLDELTDDESDSLFKVLIVETGLIKAICERGFDRNEGRLYAAVVRNLASDHPEFLKLCQDGLRQVSTEAWATELVSEKGIADLVVDMLDANYEVDLETPFQDALVEHAKGVLSGAVKPTYLHEHWSKLPSALGKPYSRKALHRTLCEVLEDRDGEINEDFFGLYGNEVADPEVLRDDTRAISKLFTPLLNRRNAKGLNWLSNILERHSGLLDGYKPEDSVQDFRDRIRIALQNDPHDPASPFIQKIANVLRIDALDPESEIAPESTASKNE